MLMKIIIQDSERKVELPVKKFEDLSKTKKKQAIKELKPCIKEHYTRKQLPEITSNLISRTEEELGIKLEGVFIEIDNRSAGFIRAKITDYLKLFSVVGIESYTDISVKEVRDMLQKTLDYKYKISYSKNKNEIGLHINNTRSVEGSRVLNSFYDRLVKEVMSDLLVTIDSLTEDHYSSYSDDYGIWFMEDGSICPLNLSYILNSAR